jgi:hypothetical protein
VVPESDEIVEKYFSALAHAFSCRWSAQGRTTESLAEVAEKKLLEVGLPHGVDAPEILLRVAMC